MQHHLAELLKTQQKQAVLLLRPGLTCGQRRRPKLDTLGQPFVSQGQHTARQRKSLSSCRDLKLLPEVICASCYSRKTMRSKFDVPFGLPTSGGQSAGTFARLRSKPPECSNRNVRCHAGQAQATHLFAAPCCSESHARTPVSLHSSSAHAEISWAEAQSQAGAPCLPAALLEGGGGVWKVCESVAPRENQKSARTQIFRVFRFSPSQSPALTPERKFSQTFKQLKSRPAACCSSHQAFGIPFFRLLFWHGRKEAAVFICSDTSKFAGSAVREDIHIRLYSAVELSALQKDLHCRSGPCSHSS